MSKIFLVGDLHGNADSEMIYLDKKHFPEQKDLTKEDVLVQLGDFGLIWYYPEYQQGHKKDLNRARELAQKNYTTLIVPGNHENYDIINSLPEELKWGGLVYVYETGKGPLYLAKRGEIYTIADQKIFTFSGAQTSSEKNRFTKAQHDSQEKFKKVKYRYGTKVGVKYEKVKISQVNLWPQELSTEEEREYAMNNLAKHMYEVDHVFAHTAPEAAVEFMLHRTEYTAGKFNDITVKFFNEVYNVLEFKTWQFGHLHTNQTFKENGYTFTCHYKKAPVELLK